jgi:CRP/FNR family transcriptional regulator, cyclic AMP receptor protein
MPIRRMSNVSRAKALKTMPLFRLCSDREARRIATLATEIHVASGRVLTVTGEHGAEFFVVVSGTATVWRQGVALDRVGPGSFFGEISLLGGQERTATVIADSDMRLLVLTRKEFKSAHFFIPPVMEAMLGVIGERLRRADEGWTAGVAAPTRFDLPPVGVGSTREPGAPAAYLG